MKIKKIFSILLCAVLVTVCLPVCTSAEDAAGETVIEESAVITPDFDAECVEGEIIISSEKEIEDNCGCLMTASESDTVSLDFEDIGIEEMEQVETYTDDENVYVAEIDGDIEEICNELNEIGDIIAEPNYILHTADFTMPTEVANNTSMYNNYQKWYLNNVMHVPEAWQEHEVTGNGVTVAVIDDGFCVPHNDLDSSKLWKNSNGTVGWNAHKNNDDISPIYKNDGSAFNNTSHGSNVAGIIGMRPNGSGGIGGAYGAELMLIQAAHYVSESSNPSFTSDAVVKAIDYARNNGADIINLSLGTTSNSSSISNAITRAYNAGILVVAAAGNDGTPTNSQEFYPASYSNVLGVMAIDQADTSRLADFSNYDTSSDNSYYEIAAPGMSIFGCAATSNQYILYSGTSQAAPLVAAAAALYMEKHPDNTIQKLKSDLLASATDPVTSNPTMSTSKTYYYKSLNVLKFLDYCTPPVISVNYSTDANIYGNFLQGLDESFEDISSYISVSNGSMEFNPTAFGNGTGSEVYIYNVNGKLYKTLKVIIFGDVTGDAIADAQDSVLINCKLGGMNNALTAAQEYAADVGNDGIIGIDDIECINEYAVFNTDYTISQIR